MITPAGEVVPGATVEVAAVFENDAESLALYQAELGVGQTRLPAIEVDVEAGGSERVTFSFQAGEPGTLTLALGGQRLAVEVLAPARLVAERVALSPDVVQAGDEATARVTVANSGGMSGSATVELVVDGKIFGTQVVTVAGGHKREVQFRLEFARAGRHTLSVGALQVAVDVVEIARPASGKVVLNRLGRGPNRFRIENQRADDAFVVLARTDDPSRPLLGVYVHGGRKRTVRGLGDGNYIVYYTVGERWDRYSGRFTHKATFVRNSGAMDFRSPFGGYNVWTLQLFDRPVPGASHGILLQPSQFPSLDGAGAL